MLFRSVADEPGRQEAPDEQNAATADAVVEDKRQEQAGEGELSGAQDLRQVTLKKKGLRRVWAA